MSVQQTIQFEGLSPEIKPEPEPEKESDRQPIEHERKKKMKIDVMKKLKEKEPPKNIFLETKESKTKRQGRPPKIASEKKTRQIAVYFTDQEAELLQQAARLTAEELGIPLTISDYLRRTALLFPLRMKKD